MNILLALIRKFEGCRLLAYLCPAGVWTVGWGATGPGIHKGTAWSQHEADDRLSSDAFKFWLVALKASPVLALHPSRHEAIADFCFNLGGTKYRASTLRKRVAAEDWDGVCDELMKWVHGGGRKLPGLVRRRAAECIVIEAGEGEQVEEEEH